MMSIKRIGKCLAEDDAVVLGNKIPLALPLVADTAEAIRDGKCVAGVLGTRTFIIFSGEKSG